MWALVFEHNFDIIFFAPLLQSNNYDNDRNEDGQVRGLGSLPTVLKDLVNNSIFFCLVSTSLLFFWSQTKGANHPLPHSRGDEVLPSVFPPVARWGMRNYSVCKHLCPCSMQAKPWLGYINPGSGSPML